MIIPKALDKLTMLPIFGLAPHPWRPQTEWSLINLDTKTPTQPASPVDRLNAFFDDPQTLSHLPLDPVGRIFDAHRKPDQDGMAVIGFSIQSRKGTGPEYRCKCNPAQYAFLLTTQLLGVSIFIDLADEKPYLKLGGHMETSAGIVVGRILAGHEAGEDTKYINGDSLDLRHHNLGSRNNPRTQRGRAEAVAEILHFSSADGFSQNNDLLHRAFDCLDQEASEASR